MWLSHAGRARGPRARRAAACALLAFAAFAVARAGRAEEREERVVVVRSSDAAFFVDAANALRSDARMKGRKVVVVSLDDVAKKGFPDADVVVAVGSRALKWLRPRAGKKAKLAYCLVSDPAGLGIGPGGPHAGVTTEVSFADQYRIVKAGLPKARRVGFLYRSTCPRSLAVLRKARAALPKGWRLDAVDIDAKGSLATALKALLASGPDVVWTYNDRHVFGVEARSYLLGHTIAHGPPVFAIGAGLVKSGAVLGADIRPRDQGRQAAEIVDAMLRGERPPAVTTARAGYAVNVGVARRQGLALPRRFVADARVVFGE